MSKLDKSQIQKKDGLITNVNCKTIRTIDYLEFKLANENHSTDEFMKLPRDVECNDNLIKTLMNGYAEIGYIDNFTISLIVNGKELINAAESIKAYNNKNSSIIFIIFVAIVSIFAFYYKGKHASKT